mmetsp:Transcript_3191/g.8845  ORF Transcript_3191/g.8845 Transcript_3191/m.8845 type:complete len:244 (+) Transcript_3191:3431-4162(+)
MGFPPHLLEDGWRKSFAIVQHVLSTNVHNAKGFAAADFDLLWATFWKGKQLNWFCHPRFSCSAIGLGQLSFGLFGRKRNLHDGQRLWYPESLGAADASAASLGLPLPTKRAIQGFQSRAPAWAFDVKGRQVNVKDVLRGIRQALLPFYLNFTCRREQSLARFYLFAVSRAVGPAFNRPILCLDGLHLKAFHPRAEWMESDVAAVALDDYTLLDFTNRTFLRPPVFVDVLDSSDGFYSLLVKDG